MKRPGDSSQGRANPRLPDRNDLLYVLIVPLLFFSIYASLNMKYFRAPLEETGDDAANALQIERAKHFREFLGPYSRFDFHHPGPVSFYYFAFMENLLPSIPTPYGRHRFAQLLLNLLFLLAALHIVHDSFETGYPPLVLFCCLVFALSRFPFGGDIFSRIWPPCLLIFPMITFVLAVAKLAFGEIRYILPAVISSAFIVQNNVSGIVIVLPFFAVAAVFYVWNRRKLPSPLSRSDIRVIAISGLVLAILFFPVVYEQFSPKGGNLSRIGEFSRAHPGFSHSFADSLGYVSDFYLLPLPFLKIKPLYFLILLWGLVAVSIRRRRCFFNYLALFLLLGLCCSVAGAMKIPGKPLYYIMYYQASFVTLLFFLCLVGLLGLIRPLRFNRKVLFVFLAVFVSFMTYRFFRVRPVPARSPKLDRLLRKIEPSRRFAYELYWRKDGRHHEQWVTATGLALKLIRRGYDVSVPPEWGFMFGGELVTCGEKKSIRRIALYSADQRVDRVRQFRYADEKTVIEFGELLPLPFPIRIDPGSPDEYFERWSPEADRLRFMEGASARVLLPLGKLGGERQYQLTIAARASFGEKISVSWNGGYLTTIDFRNETVEQRIAIRAGLLRSRMVNSLELQELNAPPGLAFGHTRSRLAVERIELIPLR